MPSICRRPVPASANSSSIIGSNSFAWSRDVATDRDLQFAIEQQCHRALRACSIEGQYLQAGILMRAASRTHR